MLFSLSDLLPKGLEEWLRLAATALVVGAACLLLGQCDGRRSERHAWQAKTAELAVKAERLQRAADTLRSKAQAADQARITGNRKEVDDAIKSIPDQTPSARQRARACLELRRQAAAAGKPQPAC